MLLFVDRYLNVGRTTWHGTGRHFVTPVLGQAILAEPWVQF